MAEYSEILAANDDGVLTLTLNRPDRLNAWTGTMQAELRDAIIAGGNDANTRCIVITGAGRGFCSGADMDGLQQIQSEDDRSGAAPEDAIDAATFADGLGPDVTAQFSGRFAYLYACPKPIIAAINGPCAGIGFVFSLYSDLRFAAKDAKFTTAFAQRGLIAEHGSSWILPRLIGEAKALDILFTARKFLGDEAAEMGLVNAALDGAELMDHVYGVARHLATQVSPRSVAIMKRQVRAAYFQSFEDALSRADTEMLESFETHDFKEGVASFVERRPPAFKGH